MTVGVLYLTAEPSLVLQDLVANTLIVNQSDRVLVFSNEIELDYWAAISKHEMIMIQAGVPAIYGMAIKAKPGEQCRAFFTSVEEAMPGDGMVYVRRNHTWTQELPPVLEDVHG